MAHKRLGRLAHAYASGAISSFHTSPQSSTCIMHEKIAYRWPGRNSPPEGLFSGASGAHSDMTREKDYHYAQ